MLVVTEKRPRSASWSPVGDRALEPQLPAEAILLDDPERFEQVDAADRRQQRQRERPEEDEKVARAGQVVSPVERAPDRPRNGQSAATAHATGAMLNVSSARSHQESSVSPPALGLEFRVAMRSPGSRSGRPVRCGRPALIVPQHPSRQLRGEVQVEVDEEDGDREERAFLREDVAGERRGEHIQPAVAAVLEVPPHGDDHEHREERHVDVFAEEAAVVDERRREAR